MGGGLAGGRNRVAEGRYPHTTSAISPQPLSEVAIFFGQRRIAAPSVRAHIRVGRARIRPAADGLYEPDADGAWAVILGVHDRDGALADLCAWLPHDPSRWWLRHGDCPVLGAESLGAAAYFGDEIRLHETPEAWLLAYGDGAAVLDWRGAVREVFEGVGRIACASEPLRQRVTAALRRWEPRVAVAPAEVRHHAA